MGGLTGRAVPKIPATAEGLSTPHVMRPFETKLNYNGKPWSTVRLKVGHSEIGGIEEADYYIAPDIIEILRLIGPPNPDPITYISLRHHISQKPVDGAIAWGVEQAHRRQSEDLINERTVPPPASIADAAAPHGQGLYGNLYDHIYTIRKVVTMEHATHLILKRNQKTGRFEDQTEDLAYAKPLGVRSCVRYEGSAGTLFRIEFQSDNLPNTLYDPSELIVRQMPRSSFSAYLREAARIFDGSGTYLTNQFKYLPVNLGETAYAPYADPAHFAPKKHEVEGPIIFPFGANLSQIEVTETSLSNQLSLVDGPPGTGKTQTILTIIANLLLRGKTVLVASPNNSATLNVAEKLEEKGGLGYLVATLGKDKNQKAFIANQPSYPKHNALSSSPNDPDELNQLLNSYRKLLELQRVLAERLREQRAWEVQRQHFLSEFPDIAHYSSLPPSNRILTIRDRISKLSRYGFSVGPLRAYKYSLIDRVGIPAWYRNVPSGDIELTLNGLAFEAKARELSAEIEQLEETLTHANMKELEARIAHVSLSVLNKHLAKIYRPGTKRQRFIKDDLFEKRTSFVREYPVTTTTTNAARNQTGKENYLYDYVIIDESSQASVLTGALALACARNAVVVGDVRQLPTVIADGTKQKIRDILQKYPDIEQRYHCDEHSLLSSLISLANDTPLATIPYKTLKEHYRCNPYIIEFCNEKFYNNAMIVMSRDEGVDPKSALLALTTKHGEHHDRYNNYNRRQATTFCEDAMPWIRSKKKDIGIAAPYRRQVTNMKQDYASQLGETLIETVHKFQGRERDVIGFLTVSNEENSFINDPHLVNVAVSRAAKQLVVIASEEVAQSTGAIGELLAYIRYIGADIKPSSVSSVFDLLYPVHAEELERTLQEAGLADRRWKSEALVELLLREVCSQAQYNKVFGYATSYPLRMLFKNKEMFTADEWRYIRNNAHVDLAVFRSMSHEFLFGIEVNGSEHYNRRERKRHDALKRSIFQTVGLPLLSMPTNGDKERCDLENMLQSIINDADSHVDTPSKPAYVVVDDDRHPWFESINDEDYSPSSS